uniref:NADH dehydrogenase subunit 6 n=1 Tax=Eulepetopsis sp. TaxID=3071118 RepID=A0AA96HRQ0_9GAST|nr:NADH dehydrogenase subunit 6 [Eulepetopsis sp.]
MVSSAFISFTMMIPMMLQPLSLGLNIMTLILLLSILIAIHSSSWYAFTLFLVYIGGLLVMFAYVASMTPNTMFSKTKSIMPFLIPSIILALIISFSLTPSSSSLQLNNQIMASYWSSAMTPTYLISSHSYFIVFFLALMLFIVLLAVVKICLNQQGPLRPFSMKLNKFA